MGLQFGSSGATREELKRRVDPVVVALSFGSEVACVILSALA
jgi:hypothetical protein